MARKDPPIERLGEVLETSLKRLDLNARLDDYGVWTIWNQTVAAAIARNAAAQPDLGMPSPAEITRGGEGGVERIIRGLRACVEKYEPRLAGIDVVQVESENDLLTLRFQVTARIASSKDETYISFDTLVDPSGRIKVQD